MANGNCLGGMACPECGSEGPFEIVSNVWAVVCDDGVQSVSQAEWEDDAACRCTACSHGADVKAFRHAGTPASTEENTYRVKVVTIVHEGCTLDVEASSEEQARALALELACNADDPDYVEVTDRHVSGIAKINANQKVLRE